MNDTNSKKIKSCLTVLVWTMNAIHCNKYDFNNLSKLSTTGN